MLRRTGSGVEMAGKAGLRIAGGAIAALAALSCGAACAQTATTWRHAIIEPKSDAGFQVMSSRGGFAAKQGIDLKLPYIQSDVVMLRGMMAGDLDSYEGGAATAIIAAARGGEPKIIGCHWQTVVHSVFARAELKSAQDMKGATMAISQPNATPDMIGKSWLAQNNIPVSEVKFASLGNDPDRYKSLLNKIALATVISIEFLPIAEQQGIKLVARGSDVMPKYQRLCTMTTGKIVQNRRDDMIRFLTAQMLAYRYALDHRDEELRVTREITGAKPDDPRPEFIFKEASNPKTGIDPTMPIDMDKLQWLQQELINAGNLTQQLDLSRIVNTELRAEERQARRLARTKPCRKPGMKPASFTYHAPKTIEEAVATLARVAPEDGRILAGGQSLVPMMAFRVARPAHLVDINGVKGLDRLDVTDGKLVIGARVRHAAFHKPVATGPLGTLLSHVVQHIAHHPIRTRGTFCGSLAHSDPASEWCAVAAALDAEMVARSSRGLRVIKAKDWFQGIMTDRARGGRVALRGSVADVAHRRAGRLLRVQSPRWRFRHRHGGRPLSRAGRHHRRMPHRHRRRRDNAAPYRAGRIRTQGSCTDRRQLLVRRRCRGEIHRAGRGRTEHGRLSARCRARHGVPSSERAPRPDRRPES